MHLTPNELVAQMNTWRNEMISRPEYDDGDAYEISNPKLLIKNPLVSVEVLTYCHEKFLGECLDSILMQKFEGGGYEIVCGVDFSSDLTLAIAKQYQAMHPDKIRLIVAQRNIGLNNNARNVRMRMRGKYAMLMEGDDFWVGTGKMQSQVLYLEKNPRVTLLFGETINWNSVRNTSSLWKKQINLRQKTWIQRIIDCDPIPATSGIACPVIALKKVYDICPTCVTGHYRFLDVPVCAALATQGLTYCLSHPLSVRRFYGASMSSNKSVLSQIKFLDAGFLLAMDVRRVFNSSWRSKMSRIFLQMIRMRELMSNFKFSSKERWQILHEIYPQYRLFFVIWRVIDCFLILVEKISKKLYITIWKKIYALMSLHRLFFKSISCPNPPHPTQQ